MTIVYNILTVANPTATVTREPDGRFRAVITWPTGMRISCRFNHLLGVEVFLEDWGVEQTDPLSYLY